MRNLAIKVPILGGLGGIGPTTQQVKIPIRHALRIDVMDRKSNIKVNLKLHLL
ncbi:MAG: hypothetical protein IT267_00325 [Saprospiraceae bacterium]|nr:hypothetical protein [Saprospiraceae bacterium]